jgi:hypothetical protein
LSPEAAFAPPLRRVADTTTREQSEINRQVFSGTPVCNADKEYRS